MATVNSTLSTVAGMSQGPSTVSPWPTDPTASGLVTASPPPHQPLSPGTVVWVTFNILLGLVGLAGNAAVCLTVRRTKSLHTLTHYLLASLAASDWCCCFFFIVSVLFVVEGHPIRIESPSGVAGELFCRLIWSLHLFWSSFFASAFNLVVVTFERYFAIVHPMAYGRLFTPRLALALAVGAWSLAYLLEIEFPVRYYAGGEGNGCVFPGLGADWFGKLMFLKSFVVSFVLPLVFLVWAYYKIIRALRASASGGSPGRRGGGVGASAGGLAAERGREMLRARRRVVQSLLIVTVLFVVLLLPSELGNVLLLLDVPVDARTDVWELFRTLTVANSVVNPFIYAVKMKRFRRAMRASLCPCLKGAEVDPDGTESTATGTAENA